MGHTALSNRSACYLATQQWEMCAADCDEAAGATRIKRLRDTLGNQMVSELLVKNIARRGYMLAIDKDVIQVI